MEHFLSNLSFSLNATIPVFIMMLFGKLTVVLGLLDEHTTKKLNTFVFKTLLPALLFMDLSTADFKSVWDTRFVLFCFAATLLSIGAAVGFSLLHRDSSERGEIIQACYRSSAAILGIAFVKNIYGQATMAALMIAATVPIYNIAAVVILSLTAPKNHGLQKSRGQLILDTTKNVAKNPIILGILIGIIWSVLGIPQPVILSKSVSYLGNMATPLSLIALGASVKVGEAKEKLPTAAWIAAVKLVLFCAVFLPVAVKLGFRGEKLIAILVMLGSATTGSCFVMSKSFGHKGVVTACTVMLTTLLSAFTLTTWLFILKTFNYI